MSCTPAGLSTGIIALTNSCSEPCGSVELRQAWSSAASASTPPFGAVPAALRVLEHVAGAIDARALAVPHAEHAFDLRAREQVGLLRAPHHRRAEVFVEARDELHARGFQVLLRAPQLQVEAAERRTAIAADETGGVQARGLVAQLLHQRQAHQRLHAGADRCGRIRACTCGRACSRGSTEARVSAVFADAGDESSAVLVMAARGGSREARKAGKKTGNCSSGARLRPPSVPPDNVPGIRRAGMAGAARTLPGESRMSLAALRVMVVEDHGFQRRMALRLLAELGVEARRWRPPTAPPRSPCSTAPAQSPTWCWSTSTCPAWTASNSSATSRSGGWRARVALVSALDPALLNTVQTMARAYGLHVLGSIEKPLTARQARRRCSPATKSACSRRRRRRDDRSRRRTPARGAGARRDRAVVPAAGGIRQRQGRSASKRWRAGVRADGAS